MTPFDNYEISPCRRLNDAGEPDRNGLIFEACEPHVADAWTLYGHIPGEGVMAIGDFATREGAEEAFQRITGVPFGSPDEVQDRIRVMHAGLRLLVALKLASDRLGTLIDADEDTENDCKAYDAVCAAIAEAEGRAA